MNPPKPKKCREKAKGCKGQYIQRNSFQQTCDNIECIVKRQTRKHEQKEAKGRSILALEKKLARDGIKTRQDWLGEAQREFNRFIRLRDKSEPCISCGRHHHGQYHAGHYQTVKARPDLRFCEVQVRKQCAPCNNNLSGNIILYRLALIELIGEKAVDDLETGYRGNSNWSIDEIKEIRDYYRQEANRLAKEG